jgi:hypothetical protein
MDTTLKVDYVEEDGNLKATVVEARSISRKIFVIRYVPTDPNVAGGRFRFCHVATLEEFPGFPEAPVDGHGEMFFRDDKAVLTLDKHSFAAAKEMLVAEINQLLECAYRLPVGSPMLGNTDWLKFNRKVT